MARQPSFYSVEGAAKALGVPLRECKRLIENGTLRVETVTGMQIVKRSNIAKLKERRKQTKPFKPKTKPG